jgi:hypothetical protein
MIYEVTKVIYFLALIFACAISIYRFKKSDLGSRILSVLICCALLNEGAASFLAYKYHNNLSLYSVYSLIEFGLMCWYFNAVVDVFIAKDFGLYIGAGGILLGILNWIFVQPINSFNYYFLLFEALMVIGLCLFGFFRFLLKRDWLTLHRFHHFWFISILLFFWCITFLTWGLYGYINQQLLQSAAAINSALAIVGAITYGCFGCVFLLYPKMKKT